ncbi:hypothetical protein PI124_g5840 [Phytophthora idaei]|nr:hypothetical protein PI125_g10655 [Phytophthora idaei]KAG3140455.1 hypothetical protein PI126_g16002 [Phytophthora idaei]KAG3249536.1 hypothetical protein PI124_g5840 [Phytophthora idaei]
MVRLKHMGQLNPQHQVNVIRVGNEEELAPHQQQLEF